MLIAAVQPSEPGRLDTVMSEVAETLLSEGVRLAGVVQTNCVNPDRHKCDMDVRVLPDGPVIRISQDLGAASRGCRLDPAALEEAVALVGPRLAAGADLLILNKFGKHEAEGHGFRDLIAEALAAGVPVLIGINGLNRAAFETFTDGMAEGLPADPSALLAWVRAARLSKVA
ncbi:DUF2478 domain-containing protein [Aurantimonas marianensis]|uniref:DUF2478 domain-containing protein n=1 Tax=Aurantimonas marianensis TaxID=2920428 RepID=A0A9X2H8L6_9HYPH|nr:DUF2478 domain-containing protein [Aurantimonas marianensis]MCP3056296.1 DUF2478 domain-containing protein [Aurantimonas marianensis]